MTTGSHEVLSELLGVVSLAPDCLSTITMGAAGKRGARLLSLTISCACIQMGIRVKMAPQANRSVETHFAGIDVV